MKARHLQRSLKGHEPLAGDYKDYGKGRKRGTDEDKMHSRQLEIAMVNILLIYSLAFFFLKPSSPRGDRSMSPRMLPFSQVIEQERRRWMPFRRALSKEDQEAFDRMFADATQQLQAEMQLGRPWRFEAVIMAVLLAHEKRLEQVYLRLEALSTENDLPEGDPPT